MKPERVPAAIEELRREWGTLDMARGDLEAFAPSAADDPETVQRWASFIRFSCTPADLEAYLRMSVEMDVRDVLATIAVPTLVVHEAPKGIAVHIGARVAPLAAPGEVLVSSTVKDLVAGSGIAFEERGATELKGLPGEWRLYAARA